MNQILIAEAIAIIYAVFLIESLPQDESIVKDTLKMIVLLTLINIYEVVVILFDLELFFRKRGEMNEYC